MGKPFSIYGEKWTMATKGRIGDYSIEGNREGDPSDLRFVILNVVFTEFCKLSSALSN